MDLRALEPFARDHHSLVTRQAFVRSGQSDRSWYRALERGLLDPVHSNVARVIGAPTTAEQAICAGVLAAGSGALASHRSAARLWGIPRPDGEPVDVILPRRTREATLTGVEVHRPRDLLDLKRVLRRNIPTTNILRTLCDLGALDPAAVPGATGHVVSTGMASPAALWNAIARHSRRGRPGVPALRAALAEWVLEGKPVDSVLEPAMRRLFVRHRLPAAQFHAVIAGYEVDFWIIDSPIVLECDGWESHGLNRAQFELDRVRDAELGALGYLVLRFTYWAIVRRQAKEADRIRRNLLQWAPHLLSSSGS